MINTQNYYDQNGNQLTNYYKLKIDPPVVVSGWIDITPISFWDSFGVNVTTLETGYDIYTTGYIDQRYFKPTASTLNLFHTATKIRFETLVDDLYHMDFVEYSTGEVINNNPLNTLQFITTGVEYEISTYLSPAQQSNWSLISPRHRFNDNTATFNKIEIYVP